MISKISRIFRQIDRILRVRQFFCLEIQPGEGRFSCIIERKGNWHLKRSALLSSSEIESHAKKEKWFEKGVIIVSSSVQAWFEPPPAKGANSKAIWLESTFPSGEVEVEPFLSEEEPAKFAGWLRLDSLNEVLDSFSKDPDRIVLDLAQIPTLCAQGGIEGAWITIRVGLHYSACWWMNGDAIHYACRLQGGTTDPSLIEKEILIVLEKSGPKGWEACPISLLEKSLEDRFAVLVEKAGRKLIPFPLAEKWMAVPKEFLIVAASVEGRATLESFEFGPIKREIIDRQRASRLAFFLFLVLIFHLFVWIGFSVNNVLGVSENKKQTLKMDLEKDWLDELEAYRSSARKANRIPPSRFLSEVSYCLTKNTRINEWNAGGDRRVHQISIETDDERSIDGLQACIDSSVLFDKPEIRSTEVFWAPKSKNSSSVVKVVFEAWEEMH